MKVIFLGSSHGVPEPGRKCSCIMIEVGENHYFVDMGMPAIDELVKRGIRIDTVKGVFISHMHGDHTHGLLSFVDLADWYYKTYTPQFFFPRESAIEAINSWISCNRVGRNGAIVPFKASMNVYREGQIFDDGVIYVEAIANQHIDDSYSFLVVAEGKRILFTGDLRKPELDFPISVLEDEIDLLICESAHFPVTDYLPIIKENKIKQICVTHYVQSRISEIYALKKEIDTELCVATDGLEILL